MRFRKHLRGLIARPRLQRPFRFLYRVALAGMNYGGAGSAESSGDELALRRIVRQRTQREVVVFDVGANVGHYIAQTLEVIGGDARIYAFEPSATAFARLRERFAATPNVHLERAGVGAMPGEATLWSPLPGSVLASTYANPLGSKAEGEPITIVTLDDFCEHHGIFNIGLLKLDLEGGELEALRGAARLLSTKAIDTIQFEFGQPSIGARTFFLDLFTLLAPSYDIYRVLPAGLERIAAYHETLEVFMSTNYLAIART